MKDSVSGPTPGPWRVSGDEFSLYISPPNTDAPVICDILPRRSSVNKLSSQDRANARLIAAAPELLEAAKHAAMEWRLHGQLTDSCRVLERAIAKAEGR